MNTKDLEKQSVNAWTKYSEDDLKKVFELSERYRKFMSVCKTERECVTELIKTAEENGFKDLKDVIEKGESLKAGDKVYANNMGKNLALFVIGTESLESGLTILGAHIDSPRLDLKQNPLYESNELALLKTHYYGEIGRAHV